MTKFNCIYGLLAVLFSSIAFGQLDSLEGQRLAPDNESVLFETSISYAIARQGQRAVDSSALVRGFAETSTHVYSLSSKLQVVQTRVEGRIAERHWPLTRWPQETQDSDVSDIYNMEGAQEGDVWHLYAHERLIRPNSLGCLANTPLRYGDIEGNGLNSLALYIGKNDQQLDWVLFSPSAGKTEFSARLALQDFKNAPEQASVQYMSDALGHLGAMPGRRAYAKVYIDDFDGDEQQDILVWRKRFESLPSSDEREGFSLVKEVYRHYKKVEDEYQPQETDEATIKGWLAENELTWQKGYPNKSECEGEEGELIPEMHDPLLNDPDVLQ